MHQALPWQLHESKFLSHQSNVFIKSLCFFPLTLQNSCQPFRRDDLPLRVTSSNVQSHSTFLRSMNMSQKEMTSAKSFQYVYDLHVLSHPQFCLGRNSFPTCDCILIIVSCHLSFFLITCHFHRRYLSFNALLY